ncbi:MAG: hypothetical protein NTX73_00675 [Rhodobacterales bacterium]|jgi:hypothetical protein|nr:hypothetical protein [Rhodobacterales bacterium]
MMTESDWERARIKGLRMQVDAPEQASVAKDCGITFRDTTLSPTHLSVPG